MAWSALSTVGTIGLLGIEQRNKELADAKY
jgi:hypothetical protein